MAHLSDFSKQHRKTFIPAFNQFVCPDCGIALTAHTTGLRCTPISPRPDIEAMKSIGRNNHG